MPNDSWKEKKEVYKDLVERYGKHMWYNGDAIKIELQKLTLNEQENITHELYNKGYRLNRIGKFANTGNEFAEFIKTEK